jgi:hypothetical protein
MVDESTGEILSDAKNEFEKVVGDLEELRGDYQVLTLHSGQPEEVTILLDKIRYPWEAPFMVGKEGERAMIDRSRLDPTGLVPSFCEHGLANHPETGEPPRMARTWVRSRLLTLLPGVPPRVYCHCKHDAETTGCLGDGFGGGCPALA